MHVLGKIGGRLRGLLGGELGISKEESLERVEVGGVVAECHWDWPEALDRKWNALVDASAAGTTFVSPTWQMRGVAQRLPPGSLRALTVRRGEELLGILPMQLKAGGFLESAGYEISDYLDPLTNGVDDEVIWSALLKLMDEVWDRNLKAVTFRNVRDSSTARMILSRLAGEHGLVLEESVTSNAARIQLPETWEGYLESLDGHERKELRRKIRKVETQANGKLVVIDHSNITPDRITTAMDLIEAADQSKREWLNINVRPLLTTIGVDLVKGGRMRVLMLMLNQTPAACLIELPSRSGPLLYNSGFDPAQRQWSPGAVTFGLAIKDAIEHGGKFFDMLRGDEPYKYKMGAKDSPVYQLVLHR
jgi:CelD/BcsL family acetyltransferase involved in cellulose biosynthesis